MKTCTKCGHRDNPYWRHSRFDFNADYMREDDFAREYPELYAQLPPKPLPLGHGHYVYYRRGKKEKQVYRVPIEDYKVETEKSVKMFDGGKDAQ